MKLYTERLILRPWKQEDAPSLYRYAMDQRVGPIAGWKVHRSVEESKKVIQDVLSKPFTYAIVLKSSMEVVGSIGLMRGIQSNLTLNEDEAEIGYWIGVPYWGQGLMPEAVKEIIRYGFEELGIRKLWCGYFDGNEQSYRVQKKCGFCYHHTNENVKWELMNDVRTEHVTCLKREVWEQYQ